MVVQLFNAKAASPKVLEVVMDIVHNLITMHETEEEMEDEEEEPPPVIDVGPVVESEPAEGNLTGYIHHQSWLLSIRDILTIQNILTISYPKNTKLNKVDDVKTCLIICDILNVYSRCTSWCPPHAAPCARCSLPPEDCSQGYAQLQRSHEDITSQRT